MARTPWLIKPGFRGSGGRESRSAESGRFGRGDLRHAALQCADALGQIALVLGFAALAGGDLLVRHARRIPGQDGFRGCALVFPHRVARHADAAMGRARAGLPDAERADARITRPRCARRPPSAT
jgi:hypothetical protein